MAESPARLLMGKSPKSYSRRDLEEILRFYGQPCTYGSLPKAQLILQVRSLAKDFGLGSVDRNEALHYRTSHRRFEKQRRKHSAILSRIQRQIEAERSGSPDPAGATEPSLLPSSLPGPVPRVVIVIDEPTPSEQSQPQSQATCSIYTTTFCQWKPSATIQITANALILIAGLDNSFSRSAKKLYIWSAPIAIDILVLIVSAPLMTYEHATRHGWIDNKLRERVTSLLKNIQGRTVRLAVPDVEVGFPRQEAAIT
ncbi:MAG: hypothetical protein M1814_000476 [Vezdaea aestivalis]|nr:MAG: hypothetical protein M1814_000476 [Vezdaea aestivalis]